MWTLHKKNSILSCCCPPPSFFPSCFGGGGGWVGGLCWWWCESRWSPPDQRRHICSLRYHLLSFFSFFFYPPSKPTKKRKNCHNILAPNGQLIPYQGWPHQPPHTHAHTQSHTCGQSVSVQKKWDFFFPFLSFFLFWGSLLLLWGMGLFSLCVFLNENREERVDSKGTGVGVFSKGNTTMLFALGPWKRERKRGWVSFWLANEDEHQFPGVILYNIYIYMCDCGKRMVCRICRPRGKLKGETIYLYVYQKKWQNVSNSNHNVINVPY